MKFKFKSKKPTREQLGGLSPSEFKTVLKRRGHKIYRDFFKTECVSYHKGRAYRFRWWSDSGEFLVDVSCPSKDFDRWANSTEYVIAFCDWVVRPAE
jgi:hypothetical protein